MNRRSTILFSCALALGLLTLFAFSSSAPRQSNIGFVDLDPVRGSAARSQDEGRGRGQDQEEGSHDGLPVSVQAIEDISPGGGWQAASITINLQPGGGTR